MKCDEAQGLMQERVDGHLGSQSLGELNTHLHQCPDCQQEWRELEQSWELLGSLPEMEPSPLFRARVWEKIRQQPTAQQHPSWLLWLKPVTALFTAAVALFCLQAWLRPPMEPSTGSPQAVVAPVDSSLPELAALDPLAGEDSEVEDIALGNLSDDYLACSTDLLQEALEDTN